MCLSAFVHTHPYLRFLNLSTTHSDGGYFRQVRLCSTETQTNNPGGSNKGLINRHFYIFQA